MPGGDNFRSDQVDFHPCNDELQRGLMIDPVSVAPLMCVKRLSSGVVDNEMRITLHAIDPSSTQERQRVIHSISAELQTGGASVENNDGFFHGQLLQGFRSNMGRNACLQADDTLSRGATP
jgi:hypothetical protein